MIEEVHINDEFILTKKFKSSVEFSMFIEEYCLTNKIGYMDGVIDYCTKQDIDVELIAPLISKSLKEKIRVEAEEQNFFRSKGKLEL